jgi:biotin synthase
MNIIPILHKIDTNKPLDIKEVVRLLNSSDEDLVALYKKADEVRSLHMGDDIFLRGIIEFSNYCKRDCFYCGIQRSNKNVKHYRIPNDEIISTCKTIAAQGMTTVVLQSGEDPFYTKERMAELIRSIKAETDLAVTLSVGERDEETYRFWRDNGMDRYLIRFETSDPLRFRACHPDDDFEARMQCIRNLKKLGVQTGSGFLIGLPGETMDDLAKDILFCTELDLDMIGVGPFIPHEKTPFANTINPFENEICFKTIAILRLLNKDSHIPATTAFDAIDPDGRNLLLKRGANIFMPNATPAAYRKDYLLYPGKPCVDEGDGACAVCAQMRISSIGRSIGKGPGHSRKGKYS